MIKKLKEEVSNLKQLLAQGGNLGDLKLSPPSSPTGNSPTKKQKENKAERESLAEQLFELQAEFDHYKDQKTQQIEELTDKAEKLVELEAELEQYVNQEGLKI